MSRLGDYARSFGAVVAAGAAVLGLSWFLDSKEPTVIKTYTENGRQITLLDHDGDLSTAEERVTRGRFSAYGSDPPEGGSTEKREFNPPRRIDGRDVNTKVVFYDADRRKVGEVRTLEPREGRLEIPEEPEVLESGSDKLQRYLGRADFGQLKPSYMNEYRDTVSLYAFESGDWREGTRTSVAVHRNYLCGEEIDSSGRVRGITMDDRGWVEIEVPTDTKKIYSHILFGHYPNPSGFTFALRNSNTIDDNDGWSMGHVEGDDVVITDVRRHCDDPNTPPARANTRVREGHKSLHEYDDLEVGTRLPGLGKELREIYEAFNQKAKEAVEKQSK